MILGELGRGNWIIGIFSAINQITLGLQPGFWNQRIELTRTKKQKRKQ